jgi:hypothetical protein
MSAGSTSPTTPPSIGFGGGQLLRQCPGGERSELLAGLTFYGGRHSISRDVGASALDGRGFRCLTKSPRSLPGACKRTARES